MQCGQCIGRRCEELCRKAGRLSEVCSKQLQGEGQYMGEVTESVPLVWFSSQEGRQLFSRSMQNAQAESYFPLTEQFLTQSAPPNCGPATLAMVLNSLRIDPGRVWKNPWRWFTEETLTSCHSIDSSEVGTTMHKFALIAECNGTTAQTFFAEKSTVKFFRSLVRKVTATHTQRLVVCFDRAALGQTGTGHYSPVAAYDAETDRVLILDVARFKYPPYWVPVEDLFKAMVPIDECTGKSRGFFVVSHEPSDSSNFVPSDISTASSLVRHRFTEDERVAAIIEEVLLDRGNQKVKAAAAKFLHDVRIRLLTKDDDIHGLLNRIRLSAVYEKVVPVINSILQRSCESPCTMTCGVFARPGSCAAPLLGVGISRPIDFFIRSIPQDISELVIAFLIEKGDDFLVAHDLKKLSQMSSNSFTNRLLFFVN
jgi:hypothetical protein